MSDLIFYDRTGRPVAYSDENETLYGFNGHALGYVSDRAVYSFPGRFLGWIGDGWIHDRVGACMFFSQRALGGPVRPAVRGEPARRVKQPVPARAARTGSVGGMMPTFWWSPLSVAEFFEQGDVPAQGEQHRPRR